MHGWAAPHSLPQEGLLQRPHCHSNSQTGSPGTHWAHSAGPAAGGPWGLWRPLLSTLACSRCCYHHKTLHSQLDGAPQPQTPRQGSTRTCSAYKRLQGSLATVAREMWCGHRGSTHGGCVCSHETWSQTAGAAGVGTAAEKGLDQRLAGGGGSGFLWGYPGRRAAPDASTPGFWNLRQGSPEGPKTSRGPWAWCARPVHWGHREGDGRVACYRAPRLQASTAAGSCSGWVAQWHR